MQGVKCAELTREVLSEEYHVNGKSVKEIAKERNVTPATIFNYLKAYGIETKNGKPTELLTREVLEDMYVKQNMSVGEIAKSLGIKSATSVKNRLAELGIKKRKRTYSKSVKDHLATLWQGHGDISGSYWCSVRNSAKTRGLSLDVGIEDAWAKWQEQGGRCALSGVSIHLVRIRQRALDGLEEQTASLDRIDSELGYVVGNIQWVHKRVQRMKMDTSDADFVYWCSLVAAHNLEASCT